MWVKCLCWYGLLLPTNIRRSRKLIDLYLGKKLRNLFDLNDFSNIGDGIT